MLWCMHILKYLVYYIGKPLNCKSETEKNFNSQKPTSTA